MKRFSVKKKNYIHSLIIFTVLKIEKNLEKFAKINKNLKNIKIVNAH